MSGSPFLDAVARRIGNLVAEACPDVPQPGLLVALSGGPDSVSLLLAAHRWQQDTGLPLAAAHFDHKLRGQASTEDTQFCQELCRSLDIPLLEKARDPRPVANRRGLGLEEAGRHLRLEFFAEILEARPELTCVAKGQHRNDQVETLVMRFFRGTGPGGLTGIQPVSGHFIHPLLDHTRGEILAFLEAVGQPWRTDASNLTGDNTRARLRRELLPLARELFGEGCDQAPLRLAHLTGQDQAVLTGLARTQADRLIGEDGQLAISPLLELPAALSQRVLLLWLDRVPESDLKAISAVHVMNILAWLREGQSGTGLDLPQGLRLVREFQSLRMEIPQDTGRPAGPTAAAFRVRVTRHQAVADPVELGRTEGAGHRDPEGAWNLSCPAHVLQGNLNVRNPRPGDRFQPFGLDGTRKLSDLFREQRIPESRRGQLLVVADDLGILWIVGVARSERTRMLPISDRIVTICVTER